MQERRSLWSARWNPDCVVYVQVACSKLSLVGDEWKLEQARVQDLGGEVIGFYQLGW